MAVICQKCGGVFSAGKPFLDHTFQCGKKQTVKLDGFEKWLRTVCFQAPTPEAYELAKSAWIEATTRSAR